METAAISRGGGNILKFRSQLFSLCKVIKSSSWFSHIYMYSSFTVCKMKHATSFVLGLYLIHDNAPVHKNIFVGCTTLRRKCCSSKVVSCAYPYLNPDEMWSESIFRGLLFYGKKSQLLLLLCGCFTSTVNI